MQTSALIHPIHKNILHDCVTREEWIECIYGENMT